MTRSRDVADVLLETVTGELKAVLLASAPTGWLLVNGDTMGSAASGATQASDSNEDLFTALWDNLAEAQAPVSTGRGASAAADWAANKTITLPDFRGRALIGAGTGAGLTARTLGDTDGAETHQLTEAELASHSHTFSGQVSGQEGAGGVTLYQNGGTTATSTVGSDTAHNNMQPWGAVNWIIKL